MTANLIHSRDTYYIVRDILKCLDSRVANHGERTAFILYNMLKCSSFFEEYELAELCMIAMMHDIGSYKTNPGEDMLKFESRECLPHTIYGYLFLLYLTPFKDRAKIILYHHTDFNKIVDNKYEYIDVVHFLHLAERVDLYSNALGNNFDYMMFNKQSGKEYSPKALDIFYQAVKKYDIFNKLSSGEYRNELERLWEYLIFTEEEKQSMILGLMYCMGFRSEYTMLDMVTCVGLCQQIGNILLLSENEMDILTLAATLHDAGMVGVPKDIIEAPRKLTDEEMTKLRTHVDVLDTMLKGRIDREVLDTISAHHERGDGSGYPKHMRDQQMTRLQRILQVADTVSALINRRSYREPMPKDTVIRILREEAEKGKLSREVVRTVITFYDKIMAGVQEKSDETLLMYRKLKDNYENTYRQIKTQ